MTLRRLFGGTPHPSGTTPDAAAAADAAALANETSTVRRIVAQLESLPAAQRRFIAGFAYVLSRVANADMDVSADEIREMERTVMDIGGVPEAQAVLIVEIAKNQAELYGGTEDFLVTREFARDASPEDRRRLLRCCFAIGAADQSIRAEETAELDQIARELGFTDEEVRPIRAEFSDKMSAVQQLRQLPGAKS